MPRPASIHPPFPQGRVHSPFDARLCAVIEETRPTVVSFHFGLPPAELLSRVKAAGALILSSATTVAEARWLEQNGVDAIIAQGREAGGHRGMFLSDDSRRPTACANRSPLECDERAFQRELLLPRRA